MSDYARKLKAVYAALALLEHAWQKEENDRETLERVMSSEDGYSYWLTFRKNSVHETQEITDDAIKLTFRDLWRQDVEQKLVQRRAAEQVFKEAVAELWTPETFDASPTKKGKKK